MSSFSGVSACTDTNSGLISKRGWTRHSTAAVGTEVDATMSSKRSNPVIAYEPLGKASRMEAAKSWLLGFVYAVRFAIKGFGTDF